jgi:VWFA-related protein
MILTLSLAGLASPIASFSQVQTAEDKVAADNAGRQGTFRSEADLVSVYFTVRDDKKRLISDLAQDQFSVAEDSHAQAIKFFAHHSDVVLNVGVLLDTGTNMSWILGEEAQASAVFLTRVVRKTDLGFILSYASRVETVQLPTSDIGMLTQQVESIGRGAAIGLPEEGSPSPVGLSIPGGGTVGINGKRVNEHREAHLYDAIRVGTLHYLKAKLAARPSLS